MERNNNNKNRIIILITILILVTFLLLGVTYAYYKTRIVENSKDKSISVETATIGIKYSDNNATLVALDMDPGDSISKVFSIENTGNAATSYNIILDNIINGPNGTDAFIREDWIYEIYEGSEALSDKSNLIKSDKLPINHSTLKVMPNVQLDTDDTHTYTFVLTYLDVEDEDQSIDMGKKLSFRINISETTILDKSPNNTLLYAIGRDNVISEPLTKIGTAADSTESLLSSDDDDNGVTYYYRGNVANNYVSFANMCWRIVRVKGDNSIKLILENKNGSNCSGTIDPFIAQGNWGYDANSTNKDGLTIIKAAYLNPQTDFENSIINALKNFEYTLAQRLGYEGANDETGRTAIVEVLNSKLKSGGINYNNKPYNPKTSAALTSTEYDNYYNDNLEIYYDQYIRLFRNNYPSLKSKNLIVDTYVDDNTPMFASILNMDDIVYAGVKRGGSDTVNSYLIQNPSNCWWIMDINRFVPATATATEAFDQGLCINNLGKQLGKNIKDKNYIRPVISLRSDVTITGGDGSSENPYVVSLG